MRIRYNFIFNSVVLFVFTLFANSLQAQTYLINPHDERISSLSGLPLSKKDQAAWLTAFYRRVQMLATNNRMEIKDEAGESLDQKLKKASQTYLEMHYSEASENLEEALQLLTQSFPYFKVFEDYIEAVALKLMISDTENAAIPTEALSLAHDKAFLNRLPLKVQSKLMETKGQNLELGSKDLPTTASRIFINGREQHLPVKIEKGRMLMHILSEDKLEAYWLNADNGHFETEKIWSRSIWKNISQHSLREAFEITRPSQISSGGGIAVIIRDESNQAVPLMISQPSILRTGADDSFGNLSSTSASSNWSKDFMPEVEEDHAPSILKSPWFWTGVAAVAGLGGFLIYNSSQTKTVTTP